MNAFYPSQCSCGHIYIEKYQWKKPLPDGEVGFCWCGWCKKKHRVFISRESEHDNRS